MRKGKVLKLWAKTEGGRSASICAITSSRT